MAEVVSTQQGEVTPPLGRLRVTRPRPRFVPARGLAGAHVQTILGHLWPAGRDPLAPSLLDVETVPLEVPGGDLVIAQVHGRGSGPVVYLLPGFEGSARAGYLRACARRFVAEGYAVVALNGRGCGIGAGLARVPFHAGVTDDLERLFVFGRTRWPARQHVAIGFSLSGNTLLAFLARARSRLLDAALAVHPPVDLARAAERLAHVAQGLYDLRYTGVLWRAHASRRRAGLIDTRLRSALLGGVRAIDAAWTAGAAGFASREEYYAACSSKNELSRIRTPTIILTALDDPLVAAEDVTGTPRAPCVGIHVERRGGHMGYLARGGIRGPSRWLPTVLAHYAGELVRATGQAARETLLAASGGA